LKGYFRAGQGYLAMGKLVEAKLQYQKALEIKNDDKAVLKEV